MYRTHTFLLFVLGIIAPLAAPSWAPAESKTPEPLTVVVMDPLAAPLSCPCVQGYAQRDYGKLAVHLEKQLGRPVKVHFSESLTAALQKKTQGKADLIIGKCSVVCSDAKANGLGVTPVASLTGKDGKATQTGLFVVAAGDPALTVADLKDYRVLFGMEDCEEKFAAAVGLLKEQGIAKAEKPEKCAACSEGATTVIDLHKQGIKATTVISSYAQPLLEGCGTIKKGDLRVIGETEPVPFIVAFVNDRLAETERNAIQKALFDAREAKGLSVAMETKLGFVPPLKKK